MASLSLSRKLLCLIVIAAVVSKATSTDLPETLPDSECLNEGLMWINTNHGLCLDVLCFCNNNK